MQVDIIKYIFKQNKWNINGGIKSIKPNTVCTYDILFNLLTSLKSGACFRLKILTVYYFQLKL